MKQIRGIKRDYEMEYVFELDQPVKELKQLQVFIYYNQGGMNYFAGTPERRGYYISLTPCEVGEYSTLTHPTDGLKMLVKEVGRKSKKSFDSCLNELNFSRFLYLVRSFDNNISDKETLFIYKKLKGES